MKWSTCVLAISALLTPGSPKLYGQKGLRVAPLARVTAKIDPSKRALLRGHVPAVIRSAPDMGRLNANTQLNHMIMVLSSSDEQEHVLRTLIDQQNDKNTENFHQWITPDAFQQSFGVAESDLATVSTWLTQQGFSVEKVMKGGRVLQFNGTVGTFEKAFQTEFHTYQVGGEQHISVNSDISVPEALSSVVRAIPSVNDLFKRASITQSRTEKFTKTATGITPQLTNGTAHYFGPNDFATVYNTSPLLTAGNTGKGVTIGVVGRTDIGLNDVQIYRQLFNLPANDPVFTIAGEDPGVVPGDDGESYLDVEVSGGVATGATINFVTSKATLTVDGVDLSAIYLVENNTADIISESYGQCENSVGSAGNALENALWEQAAAQGISVFVSTGDNGPASCDAPGSNNYARTGYSVSGLASTPYNVAVGGAMFSEGTGTYWSTTNPVGYGSALSYIPEIPWNESNGSGATGASGLYAGSGGISAYYATPPWQRGYGVPTTDPAYPGTGAISTPSTPVVPGPHRYLPDVALNAASGHDGTLYCAEGICQLTSSGGFANVGIVGGTSVAAPTMAGVQALINQANGGRQGQPNYYYYALSQANNAAGLSCGSSTPPAAGCAFHDITSGNTLICGNSACAVAKKIGWTAGPGFDLATGLGSPNVAQLSSQWKSVVFSSSTTSLSVSSVGSTHGTPTTLTVTVTSGSGSGTPSGDVAIYTTSGAITNPVDEDNGGLIGQTPLCTLSGGSCTISLSSLPAGSYNLLARYAGDVTFGSSTSAPIPVTINPEAGSLSLVANALNCTTFAITPTSTFAYGASTYLNAKVTGSSSQGVPTGTITITDNGATLTTQSLNATGDVEIVTGVTASCVAGYSYSNLPPLAAGSHTLSASYSGDKSFNATTLGTPVTINVTKAALTTTLRTTSTEVASGASFNMFLTLTPLVATPAPVAPTGTVTFVNTTTSTTLGSVSVTSALYANATYGLASLTTSLSTTGINSITATYSGDANYASSASTVTVTVGGGAITSIAATSTSLTPTVAATNTLTATLVATPAPTGTVYFYDGATVLGSGTLSSSRATLATRTILGAGTHSITVVYAGSATYSSATSAPIILNVAQATPTLNLSPGKTPARFGDVEILTMVVSVPQTTSFVAYIAPRGTVQFFDGSTPLGAPTPLTIVPAAGGGYGIYEAVFTTSSLAVGTHPITGIFTDPNYVRTTSNSQTVTILANTATALTLTPSSPVASGTAVSAMASVTATATSTPVVSGVVNFYDTSATPTLVGTAELTAAGTATVKLIPGVGSHTIVAEFQGTPTYPGTTSAEQALVVTAAGNYTTTGVLTINQTGASYGLSDTVTFYGQIAPNGSVQFTDTTTGTVLGTVSPTPLTQTFAAPNSFATGAASTGALISATGDFNKDGYPDVAVTNLADKSVSVLLGTGNGTFQPQASYTVGTAPYGVAVGDFNGDGNLDLAVTNLVDGTVSILLGTGTGTFGPQTAYPTGSTGTPGATTFPEPYGIAVADMNKDGIADIVTTNTTENSVSVLLGTGTGAFAAPVTTQAGAEPFTTAVADFSGDGIPDLVVINARDSTASYLIGKGDGTFTIPAVPTYPTGLTPYAVAVGDFNGDGRPDLAVANLGDPNAPPSTGSVTILLGSASGGFTSAVYPTGVEPTGIVALDYDGDGKLDLAVANLADNTIGILKGNGIGGFATQVAFPSVANPYALSVADFNGDGKQDLVITAFGGKTFGIQLGTQTAVVTLSGVAGTGDSITASYVSAAGDAYATSNSVQTTPISPTIKRLSTKRAQ